MAPPTRKSTPASYGDKHHQPTRPDVAQARPYRRANGVGDQLGGADPDVAGGEVELGSDGGDGGEDDGGIEGSDEEGE